MKPVFISAIFKIRYFEDSALWNEAGPRIWNISSKQFFISPIYTAPLRTQKKPRRYYSKSLLFIHPRRVIRIFYTIVVPVVRGDIIAELRAANTIM